MTVACFYPFFVRCFNQCHSVTFLSCPRKKFIVVLNMGRKLSSTGKNTQCRIETHKPFKIKKGREKPILPRKMLRCLKQDGYIYHRNKEYTNKQGQTKMYVHNTRTFLSFRGNFFLRENSVLHIFMLRYSYFSKPA